MMMMMMEMEYQSVKSALKSRTLRDNTTPFLQAQGHLVTDDALGGNEDVDGEGFPVDDLFIDFSNEEEEDEEEVGSISSYDEGGELLQDGEGASELIDFSAQLAVPDDDLAGLEWFSRFVDDDSLLDFPGSVVEHPSFPSHVPVKARSKRPRVARKDRASPSEYSSSSANQTVRADRRCTHCLVQRTPQWRSGPLGPKTLCNACGVRYKSGRLLPEYRPACSPTFSMEIHSNSHRKVVEMRRRKAEAETAGLAG